MLRLVWLNYYMEPPVPGLNVESRWRWLTGTSKLECRLSASAGATSRQVPRHQHLSSSATLLHLYRVFPRLYVAVPGGWSREGASSSPTTSSHHGGNPGANLKSISHRCCLFEVAFVWELTTATIVVTLGCLQDGPCTLDLKPQTLR